MPDGSRQAQDLFRRARAAAGGGDRQSADRLFRQVLDLDPDHAGALGFLGLGAFERGDYAESERWLRRALSVTPDDALLHQNLGLVLKARGDDAAALDCLDRALAADPGLPMTHLHRGALLASLGRDAEACEAGARAVALNPALDDARELRRAPAPIRQLLDEIERARRRVFRSERKRALEALTRRFGDAAMRRASRFVDVLNEEAPIEWAHPMQRPSWMYFPGLAPSAWFEPGDFDWVAAVQERAPAVREELRAVLAGDAELAPSVEDRGPLPADWRGLAGSAAWSSFHLYKGGERVEDNCRRCPQTAAMLEALPLVDCERHAPEAFFSILRPGTHIPPHVGLANTKLAVHLPLIIPDGCSITVGGETRRWREGNVMVFDDSFEHEAANEGGETRVVLIFEVWNPQLTEAERETVRAMISVGNRLHGHWERVAGDIVKQAVNRE